MATLTPINSRDRTLKSIKLFMWLFKMPPIVRATIMSFSTELEALVLEVLNGVMSQPQI